MLAKRKITCADFKKLDIVEWLFSLGYTPTKVDDNIAWYISLFRPTEKDASFKVNRKRQLFIDFGDDQYSGDIIDLACFLFKTDVKGLLHKLNSESFSFRQQEISIQQPVTNNAIKILEIQEISDFAIISYLKYRGISLSVAKEFCKQIIYTAKGFQFKALGLQNIMGEWELRIPNTLNKFCSKKAYSLISTKSKTVIIFEGMFDMLTYCQLYETKDIDLICLNSINQLPKTIQELSQYEIIEGYFDNDLKGEEAKSKMKYLFPGKYFDKSSIYKEYKDFNEYWMALCKKNKH
jgi:hypothetical protein